MVDYLHTPISGNGGGDETSHTEPSLMFRIAWKLGFHPDGEGVNDWLLRESSKEAMFFRSREEFLDKEKYYLVHDHERRSIAAAGLQRCRIGGNSHQDRTAFMLVVLFPDGELAKSVKWVISRLLNYYRLIRYFRCS